MVDELLNQFAIAVIVAIVSAVVSIIGTYFLTLRSQKHQTLQSYISDVVEKTYPDLYYEIQENSKKLDNFLEDQSIQFEFPNLNRFFDEGLDSLMKKHHPDLYKSVKGFLEIEYANFEKLNSLKRSFYKTIFAVWEPYLRENLPEEYKGYSEVIATDLIRTIDKFYVLPELLAGNEDLMKKKLIACILKNPIDTNDTPAEIAIKREFGIEKTIDVDFDSINKSLIQLAKPSIDETLKIYEGLKEKNRDEVKVKLLPLFKKYIANPV